MGRIFAEIRVYFGKEGATASQVEPAVLARPQLSPATAFLSSAPRAAREPRLASPAEARWARRLMPRSWVRAPARPESARDTRDNNKMAAACRFY